jgi:hypothetical protein
MLTVAARMSTQPLSLVDIAIDCNIPAVAVGGVIQPVALVVGPVLPDLLASPAPVVVFPLPFVSHPPVEVDWPLISRAVLLVFGPVVLERLQLT